jgi:hypothetical protein
MYLFAQLGGAILHEAPDLEALRSPHNSQTQVADDFARAHCSSHFRGGRLLGNASVFQFATSYEH